MKLSSDEVSEETLRKHGLELITLLKQGEFHSVVDRFGYMLAFDRDPVSALQKDLESCVAESQERHLPQASSAASVMVKYLKLNESNILAVVECEFEGPQGCPVLAELVVTMNGKENYVSLEQVSIAA